MHVDQNVTILLSRNVPENALLLLLLLLLLLVWRDTQDFTMAAKHGHQSTDQMRTSDFSLQSDWAEATAASPDSRSSH